MSRRSVFAVNSFGLGLAALCAPGPPRPPAADPPAEPPMVPALIDPPGAGADEESDTVFGVMAHPARRGAVAIMTMRAICEKCFTRIPPSRGPWMGRDSVAGRGVDASCTSNARSLDGRDVVQYPAMGGRYGASLASPAPPEGERLARTSDGRRHAGTIAAKSGR